MIAPLAASDISDCAIYAGALAAVLAALIAAGVAIWRTSVSLRHDRALSERAELRKVIDEALQTAQDGIYRAADVVAMALDVEHGDDPDENSYRQAYHDITQAIRKLNGLYARLRVRLPEEAALPGAVNECRAATGVMRVDARAVWPLSSKEDRKELSQSMDVLATKIENLESEARKIVQSQLRD
jgi:hypothetical protein